MGSRATVAGMHADRSPQVWDNVLLVFICGVVVYALGLIVVGGFVGDQIFDRLGFGPADGEITDGVQRDYVQLVYAILGAVIVGWMTTIGAIAIGPLRKRETWSWWAIVAAVTVWFVLDTGASLVLGFVGHALFNVGFALALAVPLVAIRRDLG